MEVQACGPTRHRVSHVSLGSKGHADIVRGTVAGDDRPGLGDAGCSVRPVEECHRCRRHGGSRSTEAVARMSPPVLMPGAARVPARRRRCPAGRSDLSVSGRISWPPTVARKAFTSTSSAASANLDSVSSLVTSGATLDQFLDHAEFDLIVVPGDLSEGAVAGLPLPVCGQVVGGVRIGLNTEVVHGGVEHLLDVGARRVSVRERLTRGQFEADADDQVVALVAGGDRAGRRSGSP